MFEKIISKSSGDDAPTPPPAVAPKPATRSDSSAPPTSSGASGQSNRLHSDVEIKGKVRFEGDLLVDGKIDGELNSTGTLTVGENSKIKAEIKCGSVIIYGKVHGNITARDQVDLRANAEVLGDIKAAVLSMEAGAVFVGSSTIGASASQGSSDSSKKQGGPAPAPEKTSKGPAPGA